MAGSIQASKREIDAVVRVDMGASWGVKLGDFVLLRPCDSLDHIVLLLMMKTLSFSIYLSLYLSDYLSIPQLRLPSLAQLSPPPVP